MYLSLAFVGLFFASKYFISERIALYLLEFLVFITVPFFVSFKGKKINLFIALMLVLYVIACLFNLYIIGRAVSFLDFLRAVKPIIYIILLILIGPGLSSINGEFGIFRHWLLLFFILYVVDFAVFSASRPNVVWENNFEIPFLVLLWVGLYIRGEVQFYSLSTLALVGSSVLSMSRSGIVITGFVVAVLYLTNELRVNRNFVYKAIGFICVIALLLYFVFDIFHSRQGHLVIEELDRFIFLDDFLSVYQMEGICTQLFGSGPLSELPFESCERLSFYYLEFGLSGANGECYSVIWHSGILRILHDYGFVGLFLISFFFYQSFRRNYSILSAVFMTLIPLLSGLSVSGFYSVYIFIASYLLMLGQNKMIFNQVVHNGRFKIFSKTLYK